MRRLPWRRLKRPDHDAFDVLVRHPVRCGAPGRGSSSKPSQPLRRNGRRHLQTVACVVPRACATAWSLCPAALCSTMRPRRATACEASAKLLRAQAVANRLAGRVSFLTFPGNNAHTFHHAHVLMIQEMAVDNEIARKRQVPLSNLHIPRPSVRASPRWWNGHHILPGRIVCVDNRQFFRPSVKDLEHLERVYMDVERVASPAKIPQRPFFRSVQLHDVIIFDLSRIVAFAVHGEDPPQKWMTARAAVSRYSVAGYIIARTCPWLLSLLTGIGKRA